MMKYAGMSIEKFTESLAEKTPTPGGGSASAAAAAMGAALGMMAMRFSVPEERQGAIGELDRARTRLLQLIDEDSAAYRKVSDAFAMPKGDPEQKRRRQEAVQSALVEAARVPLETMRVSLESLESIAAFLPACNPNLKSDCLCGMSFLRAGLDGAAENVRINVDGIKDREIAARLANEADVIFRKAVGITRHEGERESAG